jgi:hypothetical protein
MIKTQKKEEEEKGHATCFYCLAIFGVIAIRMRIASMSLRNSFKLTRNASERTRTGPWVAVTRILFISTLISCISSINCFKYCLVSSVVEVLSLLLLLLLLRFWLTRMIDGCLGRVRDG